MLMNGWKDERTWLKTLYSSTYLLIIFVFYDSLGQGYKNRFTVYLWVHDNRVVYGCALALHPCPQYFNHGKIQHFFGQDKISGVSDRMWFNSVSVTVRFNCDSVMIKFNSLSVTIRFNHISVPIRFNNVSVTIRFNSVLVTISCNSI